VSHQLRMTASNWEGSPILLVWSQRKKVFWGHLPTVGVSGRNPAKKSKRTSTIRGLNRKKGASESKKAHGQLHAFDQVKQKDFSDRKKLK